MAYSTQSDLLKKLDAEATLISLTDDADPPAAVDADVVTRAISAADALIDSYVGKRYATPLSTTPDIVRDCSVDLAIYYLYERSRFGVPEDRRRAYEDRVAWLKAVAKSEATLGALDPDGSPPTSLRIDADDDNPERVLTRDEMENL